MMKSETDVRQMVKILEGFNNNGKHNDEILALKWVLDEYPLQFGLTHAPGNQTPA